MTKEHSILLPLETFHQYDVSVTAVFPERSQAVSYRFILFVYNFCFV
jgi:hypothetical protein